MLDVLSPCCNIIAELHVLICLFSVHQYLECSRIRNPQQIILFLLFSLYQLSESQKKPLTVLIGFHFSLYLAG